MYIGKRDVNFVSYCLDLVSIVGASYGSYLKDSRLERLNETNLNLPDEIVQLLLKKLKSLKSKWIHSLTTFSNQQNLAITLNLEASSTATTIATDEAITTTPTTTIPSDSVVTTVDTDTNTNNRSSGRKKGNSNNRNSNSNSNSSSSKKSPSSSSSSSITLKEKNSLQYDMKSVMRILIDVNISYTIYYHILSYIL